MFLVLSMTLYFCQHAIAGALPQPEIKDNSFEKPVMTKLTKDLYAFRSAYKTHVIHNEIVTIDYAKKICKDLGMELASVESEEENMALSNAIREFIANTGTDEPWPHVNMFWVSGEYRNETNQWVWASTGEVVGYTNWKKGEPNGHETYWTYIGLDCYEWDEDTTNNCVHGTKPAVWNTYTDWYKLLPICEERSA